MSINSKTKAAVDTLLTDNATTESQFQTGLQDVTTEVDALNQYLSGSSIIPAGVEFTGLTTLDIVEVDRYMTLNVDRNISSGTVLNVKCNSVDDPTGFITRITPNGQTVEWADSTLNSSGMTWHCENNKLMVGVGHSDANNYNSREANIVSEDATNDFHLMAAKSNTVYTEYGSSALNTTETSYTLEFAGVPKHVFLSNGLYDQVLVAVASLPAASLNSGSRAMVSDSTVSASGNFGAIVAGTGSNVVPVFSDGTNWRIG